MSEVHTIQPGTHSIEATRYHAGPGVSKSNLDLIHESPALLEWSRKAPMDEEAKAAVNIGTAFHALALEPDLFNRGYVADFHPPKGAISTVDGLKAALTAREIKFPASGSKAALTALLLDADPNAPVTDVLQEEWARGVNGRTVLSAAEHRQLMLMQGSVLAHPTARALLSGPGFVERCHYWMDEITGELCRARMDKTIPSMRIIIDIKTTGDLPRFAQSIREYRYHVQDAFYTDGYAATEGERAEFVFIVVSTKRDRCRYPVRVLRLPIDQQAIGRDEYRADLAIYSECRRTNVWPGIEATSLPDWYLARAQG